MTIENKPKFLRLDLQTFAEGDELPLEDKAPEDKPPAQEKTFTQTELDAILKDRLARNNSKFADYDEVKTKLSDYEKTQQAKADAELSAVERLEKQLADKEAAEVALSQQLEDVRSQAKQERIRNAFVQAATANDIAYVDAALKLADLSAVEIAEDGSLVGVNDVVAALIESNPFLVKVAEGVKPKQIGGATNTGKEAEAKTLDAMLEDAKKAKDFAKVVEISNQIASL